MPRLLDNRVIGGNADVLPRILAGSTPGYTLQVGPTGNNLILGPAPTGPTGPRGPTGITGSLGPVSTYSWLSEESLANDQGSSIQQWLSTLWTNITPAGMFTAVHGIAYGKGFFVAVGANGGTPVIAYTSIQTATVPTWTAVASVPFSGTIFGITFADDVFMACGANGEIAYSTVGINWTLADTTAIASTGASLYRVAYGYPRGWVAIGTTTSSPTSAGVTLKSINGITWSQLATPALDAGSYTGVPIYGLTFGDGKFVAVGGVVNAATNHIATSVDGISWTIQTSSQPNAAHYSIDYGNGRFVVGTNGTNATPPYASSIVGSNDGTFWYNSSVTAALGNAQAVSFGNGSFIVGSTTIYVTVDGVNYFSAYNTGWAGTAPAAGSAYGNGIFVVGSRGGSIIRTSTLPEYIAAIIAATAPTPPSSGSGNDGGGGFNTGQ